MKKKQPNDQPKHLSGHVKLEPRRLLNADFGMVGTTLTLSNFIDDVVLDPNEMTASEAGDIYTFVLADGVWATPDSGIATAVGNILTVDNTGLTDLLTIVMQNDTGDQFDIQFDDFEFGGPLSINDQMSDSFGIVDQGVGRVKIDGLFDLDGIETVDLQTANNDFGIVTIDSATQVDLNDVNAITLQSVTLTGDAMVTSGGDIGVGLINSSAGDVTLNSGGNIDELVDDNTAKIVADDLTLIATATDARIGNTGDADELLDVTLSGTLSATANVGTGGVFIHETNDMSIVTVDAGTGDIELTTDGNIDESVDDATAKVIGNNLVLDATTLNAQIGDNADANASLDVTLSGSLSASADNGTGGIFINETNDMIIGVIDAGTGDVELNAVGNIDEAVDDATAKIIANNLLLTTTAANARIGNTGDVDELLDVTLSGTLTATANVGTGGVFIHETNDMSIVTVDAGTGNVELTADGNMDESVVDATTKITGADLSLTATSDIGSSSPDGEIDIEVTNLQFDTDGEIHVTDLDGGLVINDTSRADGGGSVTALSPLTISADVTVAASMSFTATGSAVVDDDLTIDTSAIVTLNAVGAMLTFTAGDDIIFDTGTIVTNGSGNTVILAADAEGALDADRGSITNSAGAIETITTDTLRMTASDGIGDSGGDAGTTAGEALRINAETLSAVNSDSNSILLSETDSLIVGDTFGLSNIGGDAKLTVGVDLDIDDDITLGAGNLFLDVTGNVTQQAGDDITALGLALMVDGTTRLDNAGNNVTNFAAFNGGETIYRDADTLNVEAITVDGMLVTGITTSGDDVKLIVDLGDLDIDEDITLGAGNLFLDVTGNVTQQAGDDITALGLALMVDGTTRLDNAGNNVTNFAAFNGGETIYRDADTLNVEAITVDGMLVTGITTSGDDVKLIVDLGDLDIDEDITLGAGNLFLDVTGNVTQQAGDDITALGLALMVDGTTRLDNAGNNVTNFAAFNGGETIYRDADTLNVEAITVDGMLVTGITTSGDDVKLIVDLGDLDIDEDITLGAGNLFLDVTGNVTQQAGDDITALGLALMVDGTTRLDNAGNNVTNFAAFNGGETIYRDADTLNVEAITVDGMLVTGITTSGDDVKLIVDLGDLDIDEDITLGAGNLFLDVTGNVTQQAGDDITALGLALMVDGTTRLDNAGNNVTNFAAFNGGETIYRDADTLNVEAITVDGMLVTGITTSGDDVKLIVDLGDLDIDEDITLGAGNLFLDVTGNVTQQAGDDITALGLALMVDGTTRLDNAGNNVTNFAAFNGGETIYRDADTLNVEAITVDGMLVTGITTSGDDVKLIVDLGDLDIDEDITLGAGNLFLDVTGNVTQQAGDDITALGLALMVDGTTRLDNAGNNVTNFAAFNGGETIYRDADTLNVEAITVDGMLVTGITTSGDDVKLIVDLGDLDIDEDITLGAGNLFLDVTGNVTQQAGDDITALGLALMVDGTTRLDNAGNNVTNFAAFNGGETIYRDADTLNVEAITVDGMLVTGITTSDDDVKLIVDLGDLDIDEDITLGAGNLFLDVTGNVTQQAGDDITAGGLALMVDGLTTLTNTDNNVVTIAALNLGTTSYTDFDDLTVGILTVDGMMICGLNITGDLNLTTNNGDLFQVPDPSMPTIDDAAIIVTGNTVIDTGTGDICLTGGDCTGDGINDNQFDGTLTLISTGEVVLAINDTITIDATLVGGGASSYRFIGANIQITTTIVADQLMLEASLGVSYNNNVIDVTDLFLVGTGAFDFGTLGDTQNSIDNLAADIDGSLSLINADALNIGDLTFVSNCGDVSICGVNIDVGGGEPGSLELRIVDADLTQSATASVSVEGDTLLTAGTGVICFTGGDCADLPGIGNDNDFVGTVTASGTTVEIVDINDLIVGDITAVNDIRLESGDGDGDGNANDVIDGLEILQSGLLQIDGNLLTTDAAGQVLLQSDGGIDQLATSVITANDLLLETMHESTSLLGDFNLIGMNAVNRISGDVGMDGQTLADAIAADNFGDVSLTFNNTISLEISDLVYDSACGTNVAICGLDVDGNLDLDVVGDLTQDPLASIRVTGTSAIDATGVICLTGGDCADLPGIGNDNDFVGTVTVGETTVGSTVEIVDINQLIVGNITAVDDIRLESGNGTQVGHTGNLQIDGNLTTTDAAGQVLLQSDGGIEQLATSAITTNDLLLQTTSDINSVLADFNLIGVNAVNRISGDVGMDGQTLADAIAADNFGDVSLTFNNTISLEISDLVYDSACGTNVAICGLDVDGNLDLDVVGDLTQDPLASIRVTGTSAIDATGVICLTGGDCADLPGIGNDNDFVGTVTVGETTVGSTVEIVDINQLIVGNITAVNDIRLESGNGTQVGHTGNLQIDGNLTTTDAAGQVLLQSDGGIEQLATSAITTNDLLLQTTSDINSVLADFNLIGVNAVNRISGDVGMDGQTLADAIAADNFGDVSLTFNNTISLEISDLVYDSACGTNVAICGLDVDGNLDLDVVGDLTQDPLASIRVTGTSAIDATGVICLTGGDCADLPGIGNDNDFVGTVTVGETTVGTTVEIVDINQLIVGNITAVDDIRLESGNGSQAGHTGNLQIDGNLTTTDAAGQVLLQSDGGIEQLATSAITTNDLLLQTTSDINSVLADFNLIGVNAVNRISGDVGMDGQTLADAIAADNFGDVSLTFNNTISLEISDLVYDSACGTNVAICGLDVDGNLDLDVVGDLTQDPLASIRVTGTSAIDATGVICLTGGDCADLPGIGNDNDFVGTVTVGETTVGTTVEIVDINQLIVGNITAVDDIRLESGNGTQVGHTGNLQIDGNLTTTDAAGQVLLQSDGGIEQLATSAITTNDLLLQTTSDINSVLADFNLIGVNAVNRISGDVGMDGQTLADAIAADNFGDVSLTFNNTISLEISDLVYDSACGTNVAICGLDVDGNLDLDVVGDLTQDPLASIRVTGTSAIDATGVICLTGGDCADLPGIGNDNDFVGTVTVGETTVGSTVEIVDINQLIVGNITAVDDIRLESGNGTQVGHTGNLQIDGNLTTTDAAGQVLLQSDGGIEQLATSAITTNDLLLQTTSDINSVLADFNLIGVNAVNRISGDVGMDGQTLADAIAADNFGDVNLTFNNTISLEISDLVYDSACGTNVAICGLDVDGNLDLDVDGDLTQDPLASIRVTGTSAIDATGVICLTGGDCADLPGIGNDNDFVGTVTVGETTVGTTVEIVDINQLIVGNITAVDDIRLESGNGSQAGHTGNLQIDGNLTTTDAAGQVLLQSDGGIEQLATSAITTNDLLLQTTSDINSVLADFNLIGVNAVNRISGDVGMDGQTLADAIAADNFGDVSLTFNNTISLEISDLVYDSACGTNVAICGLDVDGNLDLDVVGDLTQDPLASIRVTGTSAIDATGVICLTGGDCADLPGIGNDNDFVGTVTVGETTVGSTVEIVDINQLIVGNITAVDDIRLESGNGTQVGHTGNLQIDGNLTTTDAAGQVLLQSDGGIEQLATSAITTNDLLLQTTSDINSVLADFNLIGVNAVNRISGDVGMDGQTLADAIAADNFGDVSLTFNNTISLEISDLVYDSACGTNVAICGLDVDGNLDLDVVGDLTQDPLASIRVTGTSAIDATGVICLTGGDCADLPGIGNDNDFVGTVTVGETTVGSTVEIVDINQLIVGNITAVDDIRLESGNGTQVGHTGNLQIDGNLTTTDAAGQVLLQSDGGIEQLATSAITTNDLLLQTTSDINSVLADFNLIGVNAVNRISGDVGMDGQTLADAIAADNFGDVSLTFNNTISLEISDLVYDSACGTNVAICGLDVDGNLDLDVDGDLTQDPLASIRVTGTSAIDATGVICLTGGDCADLPGIGNDNDFVGTVTVGETTVGSTVEIVDINQLIVGNITAVDDIRLESGNGTQVGHTGNLQIDGNLTTTDAAGQVLLQSDGGIEQLATSAITTNDLLLQTTSDINSVLADFNLIGVNAVNRISGDVGMDGQTLADAIAADNFGDVSLTFNNTISLEISDLVYDSACGTNVAICGLDVDGNLDLDVVGDLTQDPLASIRVTGTSAIDATGVICLTGGDCADLPGIGNDNDFVGTVTVGETTVGTTVEIVDINQLIVGNITAVDDIRLESGNGTQVGHTGNLQIDGNLTTTDAAGQVLLQSDGGIEQLATSAITTNDLLLQTTSDINSVLADFNLIGVNAVNRISGDVGMDGQTLADAIAADNFGDVNLTFNNTISLEISDLVYDSACGTNVAICGLDVDGNLDLDVDGDLTQTASIRVTGTSAIDATGVICLTEGDCTGDGLNDNDFVGEVTASGSSVEIVDSNDLVVGDITAVDDIFLRSGDSGEPATLNEGTLTLNGSVVTGVMGDSGQVLLQSDDGVVQLAGMIQTSELVLGGNITDEGTGDFVLDSATNDVEFLAADLGDSLTFVNSASLEIADLDFASICGTSEEICGIDIDGDLVLDIGGTLTQTASVVVRGASDLTATQEIWLTEGDCTGDGLNDNNFVGEVTATAAAVEIVDSNALVVGEINAVDNIFLRSGDTGVVGSLGDGRLTVNGNLTTSAANGEILLQSDEGVNQTSSSVITTNELLLGGDSADESSGDFILIQANMVDNLAADLEGNLDFSNATSLVVVEQTYDSACGTIETICGLDIGGNLQFNISGDLTQTAAVIVQGTSRLIAAGTICFTGGDCSGDLENDNNFVGEVTANATNVEIVDSNDLIVGDINAVDNIFLRSGQSTLLGDVLGEGTLTINGDLTTTSVVGRVLLQSDNGINQLASSRITTDGLLVGGSDADEGNDQFDMMGDYVRGFDLIGDNRITNVVANLESGTFQLNNVGALTIAASLDYTSCTAFFNETMSGLNIEGTGGILDFADPNIALADTVQGTNVNGDPLTDPLRYNPLFAGFLEVNGAGIVDDIGIAVLNEGNLTTEVGAEVVATDAEIYLETTASGIIAINDTVRVDNPMDRILVVAGGDLDIGVNGRFERGAMADGLLIDELNDLLIENPSDAISTFAQVDASTLNQKLQFIYGTLGEQVYESTIFWGIVKALDAVDNAFDLPSLTSTELAMLEALLFDGTNDLFESRSIYDVPSMSVDGLPPFDGTADGDSDRVLSQPMDGIFGQATDTPTITTASFRLEFLRDNPEFLNVQFLFNDANINIFENSSTELVDLNVATADFEGLARIGEQPVLEVERIEFQIPQRVEITVTPEVEFYQSVVIDENPLFVQTVQEKFVVVVFFDSEFAADDFEAKFEALEEGEKDYERVRQELIDDLKLDALVWDSTDENTALDVNQIREILGQAGLDLEDDETADWLEDYKEWIIRREKGEADLEPPPKLPRGVYKIIEVENGKAIIQGDDIDHRFVPEPVDEGGKRYDFDIKPPTKPDDDGASLRHQDTTTNRVARWSALLENETGEVAETMVAESPESGLENGSAYIGAASTTVGLLAMLCHRNSKQNKTIEDEIQSLGELKAKRPDRNIFSRAARFSRRNDRVNRKDS